MRRGYSRPFSLIMQVFFVLLGSSGVGGLIWLAARCMRPPSVEIEIIALFLILFGVLIGAAVAGVIHMRRKDSQLWGDGYEKWRQSVLANAPRTNICQGVGFLGIGATLTWLTFFRAKQLGGLYYIFWGAALFGAVQAMYGACQLLGRLIRKCAELPTDQQDAD